MPTGFQAPTPLSSLVQRLRGPSPSSSEEALGFRPLGLSKSVPVRDDGINEGSVDGLRLPKTAGEDSGESGGESQPGDDEKEKKKEEGEKEKKEEKEEKEEKKEEEKEKMEEKEEKEKKEKEEKGEKEQKEE
jgi:hypothetical protein